MNSMIGTLKCSYPSLTSDTMTEIMDNIQKSIRQKVNSLKIDRENDVWTDDSSIHLIICDLKRDFAQDDEMSWLDKSCLQLVVKRKDKPETLTFQVSDFL